MSVRRSFRLGLQMGLIVGIAVAVFKTVQSRRSGQGEPAQEPWQPIVDTPRPRPADVPTPRLVDEVGEPIETPPPVDLRMPEPSPRSTATQIEKPAPVAKPEPLDVVPDEPRIVPAKRVAKKAAKSAKKATKAAKRASRSGPMVEPVGDTCPPTHPIKGKRSSKIFHLPGMFAYDRTKPDVCFRDAAAAEAEGFRAAKR